MRESLTERAADFGIVLEDVAITHLSFGTEFTKAVEMKQVAEQDAERARFVVLKAEQVSTPGGGGGSLEGLEEVKGWRGGIRVRGQWGCSRQSRWAGVGGKEGISSHKGNR